MADKNSLERIAGVSRLLMMSVVPIIALGGLTYATNAAAQASANILEEVIVTARKRQESLQDIPISLTAISGADLKDLGVRDGDGLFDFIPGATNTQLNASQPSFSVRGVQTSTESVSGESSVAFYQDSVFIARLTGFSVNYYDVDRIEALRGPQGTVFGKNAAAGAVHVITNRPTNETGGSFSVGGGSYGAVEVEGMLNGALSDGINSRLSFLKKGRDGFTTNLLTGNTVDDQDNLSVRAQISFDIGDSGSLLVRGESVSDDNGIAARVTIGPDPYEPGRPAGGVPNGPLPETGDIRTTYLADEGFSRRDITALGAELDFDLDDIFVDYIAAFRKVDLDQRDSLWPTYGPGSGFETYDLLHNTLKDKSDQFSQEFRVGSTSDTLTWLAGLHYLKDTTDRSEVRGLHVDRGGRGNGPLANLISIGSGSGESIAIFGEVGVDFNDAHNITVGARYSRDEKDIHYTNNDLEDAGGFVDATADWSAMTGGIAYTYRFRDDANVYLSYNRGHKPGGFNTDAETPAALQTPYYEESVGNFEIGLKAEWADRRIRTNLALFDMTFTDRQEEFFQPNLAVQIIVNTGETVHNGVEGELTWLVTDSLSIDANFSLIDAEITRSEDDGVIGNTPPGVPESTWMIGVRNETEMGNGGTLRVGANYNHRDMVWLTTDNDANPFRRREGAELLNAFIGWTNLSGNLDISGYLRNAFDEEFYTHGMPFGRPGDLGGPVVYGAPRTYGVEATYSF